MKESDHPYEVIVLGSGLGGLIAGTILSKRHHRILVLKEKGYQSFCERDGFRFAPFSNFSEKRLKPGLLKKLSQVLGLSPFFPRQDGPLQVQRDFDQPKGKVLYQVILPKARIDLYSQSSLWEKEWRREFPEEAEQVKRFYEYLDSLYHVSPFQPFKQESFLRTLFPFGSRLGREIDELLLPFTTEFQAFVQLQLMSWGNLVSRRFPMSVVASILTKNEMADGIWDVDLKEIESKVWESYSQMGGSVEEIRGVERMEISWRKGVTISSEEGIYRGKFLIFNSPLHSFSNLLGKAGRLIKGLKKKIGPRYVLFPACLGIHEKVVPVGMEGLLVSIMDLEKTYEKGNLLFLSLTPKGDGAQAPEGRRSLVVLSLIPFGTEDEASLAEHQEAVMRHLNHLIPFLGESIDFIDFDFGKEQISKWSYPHWLYEAHSDFDWKKGTAPKRWSRRIYSIGKENYPYLGLKGEIETGFWVADHIHKRL